MSGHIAETWEEPAGDIPMVRSVMSMAEAGRKGGQAKVPKGFAKLSKLKLKTIARRAARARWRKE